MAKKNLKKKNNIETVKYSVGLKGCEMLSDLFSVNIASIYDYLSGRTKCEKGDEVIEYVKNNMNYKMVVETRVIQ